jgi:hypothetical protein
MPGLANGNYSPGNKYTNYKFEIKLNYFSGVRAMLRVNPNKLAITATEEAILVWTPPATISAITRVAIPKYFLFNTQKISKLCFHFKMNEKKIKRWKYFEFMSSLG